MRLRTCSKLTSLATVTTLLTGCATGASSVVCPPLRDYTPEEQAQVADEIEAAPDEAFWPEMLTDYGGLRAQVRAACE